jgi:hypothetical protein
VKSQETGVLYALHRSRILSLFLKHPKELLYMNLVFSVAALNIE